MLIRVYFYDIYALFSQYVHIAMVKKGTQSHFLRFIDNLNVNLRLIFM
jgi:hypothetical protein